MQSVPITTDVVSSNIDQGEVYNIMRLATGQWFSPGHLASSSNKTDLHDIIEILMKVALGIVAKCDSFLIGTDCICSCLSNYHVITATTIPIRIENTITLNHEQKNAKENHKINLDGQVTYKTPICLEIKKTSVKHKMLIRENSRQNHTYFN
jgi:hypothetical protein